MTLSVEDTGLLPEDIAGLPVPSHGRRYDVLLIAFGQVFQQILTLGTGIAVGRLLGASGYGLVNLLRSLLGTLSTLAPLGLDLALLKISGQYADDQNYVNATVNRLRLVALVVNLVATVLFGLWLGGPLMAGAYPYPEFSLMLSVTLIGLPLGTDLAILSAYYKGLNRPGRYALLTLYLQPVVRVILIGLAALTVTTPFVVVCINTIQLAVSALATWIDLRAYRFKAGIQNTAPPSWAIVRGIFSVSVWMALSLFVYGAMRFVDILFLGHYATSKDVGEYGALSTIAQVVQVYPLAASQTLGPTISRLYHAGNIEGVRHALSRYIYMAVLIASFIFAGVAVFGDRLDLVFGKSFSFSPTVAFLMPLGYLLSATLAPTGYSLSMTGRHRSETVILCIGAVTMVGLCWALVPIWGQVGAAAASATAFMIINLIRFSYVSSVLNFIPGRLNDLAPPFIGLACAYAARRLVEAATTTPTLISLFIACAIFSALYALICISLLMETRDREALLRTATRALKSTLGRLTSRP